VLRYVISNKIVYLKPYSQRMHPIVTYFAVFVCIYCIIVDVLAWFYYLRYVHRHMFVHYTHLLYIMQHLLIIFIILVN